MGARGFNTVNRFLLLIFLCCLATPTDAGEFVNFGVRASGAAQGQINFPSADLDVLYSTAQQRGYSGPCLQIKVGANLHDVPYTGGFCDFANAFAFAGASTPSVTKWYSEKGDGKDIVCVSGCPQLFSTTAINGQNGIWISSIAPSSAFPIPTSVSNNNRSTTIYTVDAPQVTGIGFRYQLGSTQATSITNNMTAGAPSGDWILTGNGTTFTGNDSKVYSYTTEPHVTALSSSTTGFNYWGDNKASLTLAAIPAVSGVGGFVGNSPGYNAAYSGLFMTFAKYAVAHSSTVQQGIKNQLYSAYNIPTTVPARIVVDGDSIGVGFCATNNNNEEFYTVPLLKDRVWMRNIAISGQRMSQIVGTENANIVTTFVPGIINIDLVQAASNDLSAGDTATTVFNNFITYLNVAKAAGYTVVATTVIYRSGFTPTQESNRVSYNSMIRANAAADGYLVADYDTITQLQNPQAAGYSCDGTHPTSLGYALYGPINAAVINPLLP